MRIVFGTLSFLVASEAAQAIVLTEKVGGGEFFDELDGLAQTDAQSHMEALTESQSEFFGKLAKMASKAAQAAAPALGAAVEAAAPMAGAAAGA